MAGSAILANNPGIVVSPAVPQADYAVAANFERFDGLGQPPLVHPATSEAIDTAGGGAQYGLDQLGQYPRPGAVDQPIGQVYTPGPLQGVVGTVGGQPLPVSPRIYKSAGDYSHSRWPTIQHRLGVGQHGPSALGAAQTVFQSEITSNPPVPGDLASIIAGQA